MTGLILRLALALLPSALRPWGEAAAREAAGIDRPAAALSFALGCLAWAAREAVIARVPNDSQKGRPTMKLTDDLRGPRGLALICGLTATGLGLVYMTAGGAPAAYLVMNVGAVALGLALLAIATLADQRGHLPIGPLVLGLGATLPAIALWGIQADGMARWVAIGPLHLQPSLIVVPLMIVLFARSRDVLSLTGLALAAVGLALQPDRGMAAALAAGLMAVAILTPGRNSAAAAGFGAVAFVVTLVRADPSGISPFVDQILFTAFTVHPLAGVAVVTGSAILVLPALAALSRPSLERAPLMVFGATWAAIVLAAALGNYPTPLVGYGGSAILGYMLSLLAFPRGAPTRVTATRSEFRPIDGDRPAHLAPAN